MPVMTVCRVHSIRCCGAHVRPAQYSQYVKAPYSAVQCSVQYSMPVHYKMAALGLILQRRVFPATGADSDLRIDGLEEGDLLEEVLVVLGHAVVLL